MKLIMLMTMYMVLIAALFGVTMFGVWLFDLILSNFGYWWTVILFSGLGLIRALAEISKDKSPVTFLKS